MPTTLKVAVTLAVPTPVLEYAPVARPNPNTTCSSGIAVQAASKVSVLLLVLKYKAF